MMLFLFNRINLHNLFSFITFVLLKLNDRRSIMKERRMKINRNKLERLLAAVAPTIYDINEIPHIKDIPYGSCEWQDGKLNDTRLYTVDSRTDQISYDGSRFLKELSDQQIKEIVDWAIRKINPIE